MRRKKENELIEYEEYDDGTFGQPEYLFVSASADHAFYTIMEEMEQLHQFCLLTINATSNKVSELQDRLKDLEEGSSPIEDPNLGDVTGMAIGGMIDVEIPMWIDTQEFLVKAMCLLLLSAFLERSLRSLCDAIVPEKTKIRRKTGISKVSAYIDVLKDDGGLNFEEPNEMADVRDRCRKLRNFFAHGEWENVREGVRDQPLRFAFEAYSNLFSEIESSYMKVDEI